MRKLLSVTTTQTEELITTFQKKFTQLKSDHDMTICKLQCISNKLQCKMEDHHKKSIVKLQQKNDASVKSLIISCDGLRMKLSALEDKLDKVKVRLHEEKSKRCTQVIEDESMRKKLEDKIQGLNEWILELDNERKAAEANEKKAPCEILYFRKCCSIATS
jgi:hypothetical protein